MTTPQKLVFGAIAVAVVLTIVIGLYLNTSSSLDTEYPLGVVLSLTGRGATYGERALNGMTLAADELNATRPFQDRPIKLVVEDSQSSAPQALSAFRKLIDINHIAVASGFLLSDEVLTCAPVANERQVVLFSTAAGSDKIKDAGDYVFRNRESATLQAEAIAKASVERFDIQEVAVLHSNAANGISYRDSFVDALSELGGTAAVVVGYNEGKTDYRAEIERLRRHSPRAVYLAGLDHELGLILKQAREVGFEAQFFSSAGAISEKLLEIAGPAAEGLVCGSAPFNVDSSDPRIQAFATAYQTRFGEVPDFIAANSYDAVQILARTFRAGTTDGPGIKSALYAVKDYPGVGGRTTFDEYGEVTKPIKLVEVKNGRFHPLD